MASWTDIFNLSLARLEIEPIDNAETSQTAGAKHLRRVRDVQLDVALAVHPWNFATGWFKDLAAVDASEYASPDFSTAIKVPSDCVRVLRVGGDRKRGRPFVVAEGYICTNASAPLNIWAIKRKTDPGKFSPWFIDYLSARLAWIVGKPLNASEALRAAAKKDAKDALSDMQSIDGQEGEPPEIWPDAWLDARESGDWFA